MAPESKRCKSKVSRFPNEHYTVAWICALERELTTARLAFDEIHGIPQRIDRSDTNNYTLGTVAGHTVVAACLPAGSIGNNPAAALVGNIRASFPSLRFGILAGIGGGIPSTANDIRLGDVVVSQPTQDHGGVIQVDNGKVYPNGFQKTGTLDRPPSILLNAVNSIKSRKDIDGSQIPAIYDEMFEKLNPDARGKYARPKKDHLYKARYTHPENEPTCDNCDSSCLVNRKPRSGVQVHYGVIASGNAVIKDAKIRDRFHKAYGALCVEMEAAGLMNTFPCLVVRGICDYADSHKNKEWQFYAAMVASAYSKELLSVITPLEVSTVTPSKQKTMDETEEGMLLTNCYLVPCILMLA
jgi:nucleoside phosphorylase